MQFHELVCSSINLHAVVSACISLHAVSSIKFHISLSEQFARSQHCLLGIRFNCSCPCNCKLFPAFASPGLFILSTSTHILQRNVHR